MKSPLKVTIAPEHPLLILMANNAPNAHHGPSGYEGDARRLVSNWEWLDDDIKPYATMQIEGICDDWFRRVEVLIPHAEKAGIPITLQIQTNNADINDTMPIEQIRRLLDANRCIVGIQISEASQRTFVAHGAGPEYSMGRNARYARDIIRLCGEYGLFMSWQLMTENFAAVGCSADNEALFDTIVEYGEYVIPTHEMNSEFAKYIDHLAAMGLWLSGTTAQWGVEAQSWYWSDANYSARRGVFFPGSLQMSGELYAIMFLLGAVAGATVYSIEPCWDIWPETAGTWRYTEWLAPVFKRLVKERLVPSRNDVLATMPVAYSLPRCERQHQFHEISADLDFDHAEGRLIRAAYGVFDRARDAEMIPNNSRYSYIPAMPAKTPKAILDRFRRVLRPGDISSVEQARELLDAYFPPVDRGAAWSQTVGPLVVAANTHENWFVPESVKLTVPRRPGDVALAVHTGDAGRVILTWSRNEGDRAYRVWRVRDEKEEILTREPIRDPHYEIAGALPDDRYAVSAITTATETIEGTLHLHEFLVYSSRESRRSSWFGLAGDTIERPRLGEAFPVPTAEIMAGEDRCRTCSPVEDLASPLIAEDDPDRAAKRQVMDALAGWKRAFEAEDVDAFCAFYAPGYREPDGRTIESVNVAFRSLFPRYLGESLDKLRKTWGVSPAWRFPSMRLFARAWEVLDPDTIAVEAMCEFWAGGGPEMEPSDMIKMPFGGADKKHRFVWRRTESDWKIAELSPPLLRMEQIALFRFRYQGW